MFKGAAWGAWQVGREGLSGAGLTQQHAALRLPTPPESSNSKMKSSTIWTVKRNTHVYTQQGKCACVFAHRAGLFADIHLLSLRLKPEVQASNQTTYYATEDCKTVYSLLYVSVALLDPSCMFLCALIILVLHRKLPQIDTLYPWTQHMMRTGHSIGGGAMVIPMKAARWSMKPKKSLTSGSEITLHSVRIVGATEVAHLWLHFAEWLTSSATFG